MVQVPRSSAAKPSLLLHVCCAPCSTHVLEKLRAEYNVAAHFFNPNIEPEEEYERRREGFLRFAREGGVPVIEAAYENAAWREAVRGLEGEPEGGLRCAVCFRLRLRETARLARERGFGLFTSTLSLSPHKNAALLNEIGGELGREFGVAYLEADWKKKGGFRRSCEMSREYGLYRQTYCGCLFSLTEKRQRRNKLATEDTECTEKE